MIMLSLMPALGERKVIAIMYDEDEKTPPDSPISILKEIKGLSKITQSVADKTVEINGDVKLIFNKLDKLENKTSFALGFAVCGLVISLFALGIIILTVIR